MADSTYRGYLLASRREKLLRKLNELEAPNVNNMLSMIKTVGSENIRAANLKAQSAIDSKDIGAMENAITDIDSIKSKSPLLYQDYIGSLSDSLRTNIKMVKQNEEFADTTNRMYAKLNELPEFEKTPGMLEVMKAGLDSYKNAPENVNKYQLLRRKDMLADAQDRFSALEILGSYDADLSTPDVIDVDPNASTIDQQMSGRANQILQAYGKSGNWAEAIKRADELSRMGIRTDIAIDRESARLAEAADLRTQKGIEKGLEEAEDRSYRVNTTTLDAMEDAFLDKVTINSKLPKTADYNPETDAIPRAFEEMKNHPAITQGLVKYEDFLFTVNFMDPYRQVDPDAEAPTSDPITARNILYQEQAKIKAKEDHANRLEILTTAESSWGSAVKLLGGDKYKNQDAFKQMQNINQFTFSKTEEGLKTFDAEGAIKAIDRTLVLMIKDADSYRFGGLWKTGITRASDIVDNFDVEASPLEPNRKDQMDRVIGLNYKKKEHFDVEEKRAFLELKQARERIYEGIRKGLFEIQMGTGKSVAGKEIDSWEE